MSAVPKYIVLLFAIYFCASLLHFAHNGQYLAFYPNMPAWLTTDKVYLAWLAISAVGIVGVTLARLGLIVLGAVTIAVYGGFGLDGLGHYALALCSQHTFAMNFTIWFEVIAGALLAVCSLTWAQRQLSAQRRAV